MFKLSVLTHIRYMYEKSVAESKLELRIFCGSQKKQLKGRFILCCLSERDVVKEPVEGICNRRKPNDITHSQCVRVKYLMVMSSLDSAEKKKVKAF